MICTRWPYRGGGAKRGRETERSVYAEWKREATDRRRKLLLVLGKCQLLVKLVTNLPRYYEISNEKASI